MTYPDLATYFENVDFTDAKVFEGTTSLGEFIASTLSYYPWWVVQLYRLRKLLVRLLGLVRHEAPEILRDLPPGDISFTPGELVTFFIARCAKEEK